MLESIHEDSFSKYDATLSTAVGGYVSTSFWIEHYKKEFKSADISTKVESLILKPGATLTDLVQLLIRESRGKLDLDHFMQGNNAFGTPHPDGIKTIVRSAIVKLNLVHWHEQVGHSATWYDSARMKNVMAHPEIAPHFNSINLLFELKRQKRFKDIGLVYLRLAHQTLYPDQPLQPDEALRKNLAVVGYAATIYAETQADVVLVNTMGDQNQKIISTKPEVRNNYAQGPIQRLGARWPYYVLGCYVLLKREGVNPDICPYGIISSPILSRKFEGNTFRYSPYYGNGDKLKLYLEYAKLGKPLPKVPFKSKLSDNLDTVVSNALSLFQGVNPWDEGDHKATAKAIQFKNLL